MKHISTRQNLRDSMTPLELALTSLAKVTAAELHQTRDAQGTAELQRDAQEAGEVGGAARRDIEQRLGRPVVSPTNYKQLRLERQAERQPSLFPADESDETKPEPRGE